MDLRQLRYFVAVAEELHFGRAAQRLRIAQPPLSQQIQRLERQVGFPLFERNRRKVTLTRAGQSLLAEARRAIAQADRVRETAERIRSGDAGHVRIAFVGSALYGILPAMLRRLREQAPDIELSVQEMESNDQLAALEDDLIDLGFVRPPLPHGALTARHLGTERLVAALPADHRLAGDPSIRLDALAGEPFVLFAQEHGTGFWNTVVHACTAAGFAPRIAYQAEHIHTMVGLVAAGFGVSLVPASVRQLSLSGVRYVAIEEPAIELGLALAWDQSRSFPALDRVVALIPG